VEPNVSIIIDVLSNDVDADGNQLTVILGSPPLLTSLGAQVTVQNGKLRYAIPAAGLSVAASAGTDRFSYTASDGRGGFSSTTVAVTCECRVECAQEFA
jgi:hypothetical protein